MIYNVMKNLITNKFYQTQAEAQTKLDVFYAMNKLTDLEYVELTELVTTIYAPPVVEPEVPTEDPQPAV